MDDEIIAEFLAECHEGLERIEQGLVVLEATPDDTPTLTEVFRVLHTIKGTCGFLGFGQLETVAHRGENLLSLLRDSVIEMDGDITDALLATTDAIVEILAGIEETGAEATHDYTELVARLEELSQRSTTGGPTPADTTSDAEAETAESAAADPDDTDTGAAAAEAEAVDDESGPTASDDEVDGAPSDDTDAADEDTDDAESARLGDLLVESGAVARTDVEIAASEQALGDDRPIGKILVDEGRAEHTDVETAAARQRGAADASVRVDVSVLDQLMNLVGELVLSRNEIVQLTGGEAGFDLAAPAQRLNLITSELQESVMKTRMQPIGSIWKKLPRVVRDLSRQFDKQIRLEMVGEETELDRTILEAVKDPLTHMIRNTVDHGIEDPDRRVAAGKEPQGFLRLAASHEGGQVNIEISDDGGGIDPDAVRRKAVEKGVITAEQAEHLTDGAAVQLIFAPGFSTAEKVNNVSGRGVGMDVVRTNIERIGGSVDVRTEVGRGTWFKIKIPLTLAIIPALVVRCDGHRYALPQQSLQELVHLGPQQKIEHVHDTPVYRLRDRLLPIVGLRDQLGLEVLDRDGDANIVVLNADGRSFGLIVDSIEDTAEIVIKPLGRSVSDTGLFSGATVMGDGSVALILDVNGLASKSGISNAPAIEGEYGVDDDLSGTIDTFGDRTVLTVGLGGGERAAFLLDHVDRLEEFAPDAIESSRHRDVVQYLGSVMPLVDLGPMTGRGGPAIGAGDGALNVVVCSDDQERRVGFAVAEILDIVSQPDVHLDEHGGIESIVVDGQLIDVVDAASLARSEGLELAAAVPTGERV